MDHFKQLIEWFIDSGISDLVSDTVDKKHNKTASLEINTLDDLRSAILNVHISIKNCALNTVFGSGNPNASLMFLGEAPGEEEDKQGIPFVGQSGQLLDKMLNAIGLMRDDVYITNIIPWRPPGNRTPTTQEIAIFRPYLLKHIELINPKLVVCLGGSATKALLQTSQGITQLRGKFTNIEQISAQIIPTFHPAYLLRSPSQKKEAWRDFLEIKEFLSSK